MQSRKRDPAFTLIELLVVIAIIVALLALLMPSLNRALDAAKRAVCGSNTHQQALAFMTYAADFKSVYPTADNKNKGGNQWVLNNLYGISNAHGRALRARGVNTDDPDVAGDPFPSDSIMHCPAKSDLPRGFVFYTVLHVDQYIVLTDLKSSPYSFTGKLSPARMGDPGPLTACHTLVDTTGTSWSGSHPGPNGQPAGFTQSYSDCSSRWVDDRDLPLNGNNVPLALYNSGWPWNWTWRDRGP